MNLPPPSRKTKRQRAWLRGLLVCVIFRALIPLGFMPGSGSAAHTSSWIALCWGKAGSAQLLELAQPHANAVPGEHSHPEEPLSETGDAPEHPVHQAANVDHGYCLFAGVIFNGIIHPGTSPVRNADSQLVITPVASHPYAAPLVAIPPARAPPVSSRLV